MKTFALAFSSLLLATATFASVPLTNEGKAVAKIYLSPDLELPNPTPGKAKKPATPPLDIAASELNDSLEKMSGTRLEVVRVASIKEARGPGILIGSLAREAGAETAETTYRDSVRLLTQGSLLLIHGETDDATLNGVYTLLNRLGCEWVMPGAIGEIVPKQPSVTVPDLDLREQPSFPGRNLWARGNSKINTAQDIEEFSLWKRRQKMNPNPLVPEMGAGHVWDAFIKKHKAEFEKDPTMYALVRDANGQLKRKGPQLEPTHPRVIELFVEDIKAAFEKNKWPKEKAVAFGIGPADGLGYSLSPESALASSGRIDPLIGAPDVTDLLINMGNQILERIEKEYPNVSLGYYSYSVHSDYPMRYKPHPRLNQIFAPISFSRLHSVFDSNSKTRPYYRDVVELWGKLSQEQGNHLAYRGYNWNLAENMLPYSQLRMLGEEIPWYKENRIIAVNIEATKAWAVNGPHDFLLAKLLWNSGLNWKDVLHDYCQKSFGEGAALMEEYLLAITERQRAAGQEAGSYHAYPLIYDQAFVNLWKAKIHQAVAGRIKVHHPWAD